jgi:asparagine synthase (glutamine-hydrolysing)
MCGIVGFVGHGPLSDAEIAQARRMRDGLAHRGPDGAGEWFDKEKGLYLGHRRLSIVDLSDASAQPMAADGLVASFNGEIYNYVELRDELAGECAFRTSGDTEVLLAAWHKWGTAALDRFDGMFALSLFDGAKLWIATDPFGEKPLYWATTQRGCWFASEAGVLIRELSLRFAPTHDEVATFLALGFLPAPATGTAAIHEFPAASHAILTPTGPIEQKRYWTPPAAQAGSAPEKPLAERDLDDIGAVLLTSLRRRLRADVQVGLFLSAGIDSSLIAALAARELGIRLKTLTVSFPDGADESAAAARIAAHLGLPHRIVDSQDTGEWRALPAEIAGLFGVPNDNITALSLRQMSAIARRDMTVALSGLGGDELFFGYNRHARAWRHRHLHRYVAKVARTLRPIANQLPLPSTIQSAFAELGGNAAWRLLVAKNNGLAGMIDELPEAVRAIDRLLADSDEFAFALRDFDVRSSLPGNYIPAVDRSSMRVGLEVRAPLLSRDLAELLGRMDARALVRGGQKIALRRLAARYLPRDIVDRPKQGFVFPAARYLATRNDVPPSAPMLTPGLAERIWSRRGDQRYRALAMRLCLLEALSAVSADGPAPSPSIGKTQEYAQ